MPLYEYNCHDCQSTFDALRPMSKADEPIQCVECESMMTFRTLSRVTVLGSRTASRDSQLELKAAQSGGGCCGGSCGCSH